jgi:predicted acetyltransferase
MKNDYLREATDIAIETASDEDWDGIYKTFSAAINIDGDDMSSAAEHELFEPARSFVARRDGRVVGTLGANTRQIAVPGGVVSAAHGCRGGVALTARRQGVLTRMMREHFDDARNLSEPITLCWASEGRIYHRYGYGLATRRLGLNIDTREVGLPVTPIEGKLTEGTPADFRDAITGLYERVYPERPGWSERTGKHWNARLADMPWSRFGATALRALVHEGDDGIDGYALWRASGTWTEAGPNGEVRVLELVSTTPEAYAALWQFLLTVDLTKTATIWSVSLDEPLLYWVGEPRRMSGNISDGLWVRVVDVPRALASRRYAARAELVIEVTDEFMPVNSGRWRLTGSPDSAACTATSDPADLVCDVRALGAMYLGGAAATALAGAGLIRELRPGALAEANTAFGWYQSPCAFEIY